MTHPNHTKWLAPIRKIQQTICEEFDVTLIELKSARRSKPIIAPRHIAMWMCRKLTMASLPAIARAFGDRDHTTIIHACRNAEILMASNLSLKEKTETIIRKWSDEKTA